uniref:Uncharacterized protein n=1 Tax=Anopheles coluzzii TaxID=1518534 RepID=A0A8W7P694_ANOCL
MASTACSTAVTPGGGSSSLGGGGGGGSAGGGGVGIASISTGGGGSSSSGGIYQLSGEPNTMHLNNHETPASLHQRQLEHERKIWKARQSLPTTSLAAGVAVAATGNILPFSVPVLYRLCRSVQFFFDR